MTLSPTDTAPATGGSLHLERWSATSGSERGSRANLVVAGGGHRWRANADGNGAIDALMRAVDNALAPLLGDGVVLVAFDVQATRAGHEAKANVTEKFINAVTADHYVFCGNGASKNPELEVVEALAIVRSKGYKDGPKIRPKKKFKFWFTSNSDMPLTDKQKSHMRGVEKLVAKLQAADPYMDAELLNASSFEIPL